MSVQVCRRVAASLGLFVLCGGEAVQAQSNQQSTTGGVGTIEGTVFDSLLVKAPLRGATVYVIGATFTATTDSRGRFTIDGIPEGDYSLTFAHPAFDSTGVQAPQVGAHVTAGAKTRVAIAAPRGTSIVRAACPGNRADQTGLLMGVVRDVDSGAPLPGARVASRWFELTFDRRGRHYEILETTASTDQAGVFRLCGVPSDIAIFVRAQSGTQQTGRVEIYFNGSDVAFRDFAISLGDTAAHAVPDSLVETSEDSTAGQPPRGTALVRGVIRDDNGRPLGNANVGLLDRRGTVTTDGEGRFSLGGVPAGTQTLEVRAIGYAPNRRAVVLRSGAATETSVSLDRAAQRLESVRILGKAGSRYLANNGFDDRRRQSLGWFMDADEIAKRGGIYLGDVLRAAPGLIATYSMRGRTFTMRPMAAGGRCTPAYYLDGLRWFPLDQDPIIELEKFVPLRDLVAVEVYAGGSKAPVQFDPNTGCGAVVFWTKH
jgi:hypothetical protein